MKYLSIQWPVVLVTTVVLYALVILSLPFSTVHATLFLFALIGFWSRLPGVGMPCPFWILYNLDVIDVFCIIIAINVGPVQAAGFALFGNLWSRVCGSYPDWVGSAKDGIFQAILSLLLPAVYAITQSLVFTTIFFTVGRSVLYLTVGMLIPHRSFVNQIVTEVQFQSTLLLVNLFYITIFGDFFSRLLQKGMSFSWVLFFFATAIIIFFYISFYRNPNKKRKNKLLRKVVKAAVASSSKNPEPLSQPGMDENTIIKDALKPK